MTEVAPALAERLDRHGQSHLLAGLDKLDEQTRASFLARLEQVDWGELAEPPEPPPEGDVSASRVLTLAERGEWGEELAEAGEAAYRAGDAAVLMVAGGQGTRLRFDGPLSFGNLRLG